MNTERLAIRRGDSNARALYVYLRCTCASKYVLCSNGSRAPAAAAALVPRHRAKLKPPSHG